MKKIIGILFLLLIVSSVNSQVLITLLLGDKLNSEGLEFGLSTGMNFSRISNMDSDKSFSTINLGFYFDIRMKNQFWLNTGVLVKSKMGTGNLSDTDLEFLEATNYGNDGKYNQSINYFLVPILAKYKFKNHIYLELGPQFGLAHRTWVEFLESNDDFDARIREYNRDKINKIEAGLRAGIGYKLLKGEGMNIGLGYYQGLTNVYNFGTGNNNQSFYIEVDIPIGRSKEKE